jgi:hypothetical protein
VGLGQDLEYGHRINMPKQVYSCQVIYSCVVLRAPTAGLSGCLARSPGQTGGVGSILRSRPVRLRRRSARLVCAALAVCAVLSAWADTAGASTRGVLVHRIPFGLSIEYPVLKRALGSGSCPGPALVSELRQLGSPPIRVGGDSQDLAGPTAAYRYVISPSFFTTLGCLARTTGEQITVGLNFGDGTVADALTIVGEARAAIPAAQLSFSLGNEPDLYRLSHELWSEPGFLVPAMRKPSWSAAAYARQWRAWRAMLGPIRLEGPDLATGRWARSAVRFLRADPPAQISGHFYPTVASGPHASATRTRLLSRYTALVQVTELGWLISASRATGRPAVISESNSASGGGLPGLSDSPVAAVWAVRSVLGALLFGFQQVYFHSAGTSYDPLVFNADGTVTQRPLASALAFLHRWIPVGSRLLSISRTPALLEVTVTGAGVRSVVLSSFSRSAVTVPLAVRAWPGAVESDLLSAQSSIDERSSLSVRGGKVAVRLPPGSVAAVRVG